jgi:hypothetical protein
MTTQLAPVPAGTANRREIACLRIWRGSMVLGTTLGALIAYTVLHRLDHIDLAVRSGGQTQHVGAVAVGVVAALVGLAGWGLLSLLERRTRNGFRIWLVIALTVFAVSLLGPLGGSTTAARAGLAGLHASVAALLIVGMALSRRLARRQAR